MAGVGTRQAALREFVAAMAEPWPSGLDFPSGLCRRVLLNAANRYAVPHLLIGVRSRRATIRTYVYGSCDEPVSSAH